MGTLNLITPGDASRIGAVDVGTVGNIGAQGTAQGANVPLGTMPFPRNPQTGGPVDGGMALVFNAIAIKSDALEAASWTQAIGLRKRSNVITLCDGTPLPGSVSPIFASAGAVGWRLNFIDDGDGGVLVTGTTGGPDDVRWHAELAASTQAA